MFKRACPVTFTEDHASMLVSEIRELLSVVIAAKYSQK
jgi:hypothetical protein